MNKRVFSIAYALLVAASAAVAGEVAQAAPYGVADQSCGLLGSPVAQAPMQDPVIRQAIEWIQSKREGKSTDYKLKPTPENISHRNFNNRTLILGGPETVPM